LPTLMLGSALAGRAQDTYAGLQDNSIVLQHPSPSVAEWPLVGERVYSAWSSAADNLPAVLETHRAELGSFSKRVLSVAASTVGSVLMFLGSLIVAGIIMAYGESGSAAMRRIFCRLAGPERGVRVQNLSTATVRSVASGVIGVAFIQALLLGVGFIVAGIPAAGVLALVVLLLGILQLPAAVVSLPAIAWLWWSGDASTASNVVCSIYLLVAGMADNVLKPLLLGRGVDAPMPVILLGAMGGMVTSGIIGLFAGAATLAVGYQIFMDWVDTGEAGESVEVAASEGQAVP
jgi:predicted PurR-regulated permease PerM